MLKKIFLTAILILATGTAYADSGFSSFTVSSPDIPVQSDGVVSRTFQGLDSDIPSFLSYGKTYRRSFTLLVDGHQLMPDSMLEKTSMNGAKVFDRAFSRYAEVRTGKTIYLSGELLVLAPGIDGFEAMDGSEI